MNTCKCAGCRNKKPCQDERREERRKEPLSKRNRSAAIQRSPIKQGVGTVCGKGGLKAASNEVKRISSVSPARAQQMRKYNNRVKVWKQEHPICEVNGCHKPTEDCHHKAGRIGKLLLNEAYWLPVCRSCHHKIETNPAWAKAFGYSVSRLNIKS